MDLAPAHGVTIQVSAGVGQGRTRLSAFDAALVAAGVANFNLVRLSSVIPPGAKLVVGEAAAEAPHGGFGDRLYCVYAAEWAIEAGKEAWSGVGWSRHRSGDGSGLFVEHVGHSDHDVRQQIELSLEDLAANRSGEFDYEDAVVIGVECRDQPVCAVVVATYATTPW